MLQRRRLSCGYSSCSPLINSDDLGLTCLHILPFYVRVADILLCSASWSTQEVPAAPEATIDHEWLLLLDTGFAYHFLKDCLPNENRSGPKDYVVLFLTDYHNEHANKTTEALRDDDNGCSLPLTR